MPFSQPSIYKFIGTNTDGGSGSYQDLTTGIRNIAIGINALAEVTSGGGNTAIGFEALKTTSFGTDNIAIGQFAMGEVGAALSQNIGIGAATLFNAIGLNNIAIGVNSLTALTAGDRNVAIGYLSGSELSGNFENTIVGNQSGQSLDGDFNTLLGAYSGGSVTGNNNIIIGYSSVSANVSIDNAIIIGVDSAYQQANVNDNVIIIGDASQTSILIGGIDFSGGGGGGLTANATQSDDAHVSITSEANDGVSAVTGSYRFDATSDNVFTAINILESKANNGTQIATFSVDSETDNGNAYNDYSLAAESGTDQAFKLAHSEVNPASNYAVSRTSYLVKDNSTTVNAGFLLELDTGASRAVFNNDSDELVMNITTSTGAAVATIANNAPAIIATSTWIPVTVNGVQGYIPFFS